MSGNNGLTHTEYSIDIKFRRSEVKGLTAKFKVHRDGNYVFFCSPRASVAATTGETNKFEVLIHAGVGTRDLNLSLQWNGTHDGQQFIKMLGGYEKYQFSLPKDDKSVERWELKTDENELVYVKVRRTKKAPEPCTCDTGTVHSPFSLQSKGVLHESKYTEECAVA